MRSLEIKGSTLIPPKRPDRPQERKVGKEFLVETNHLNLNIKNKNMVIHHYDVSIEPEKPFRNYRLVYIQSIFICIYDFNVSINSIF